MQSWYLLYCKRGQLQRAQEHLERQAVNCLAPMITLEKIVRGKRTAVSEPLFPNYLFVEFDPEVIHTTTINATRVSAIRALWRVASDSPIGGDSSAIGI
ncbi:transcriptional activator [Escherichia coli]|nr:transcriptional activator [Escherichia coli]